MSTTIVLLSFLKDPIIKYLLALVPEDIFILSPSANPSATKSVSVIMSVVVEEYDTDTAVLRAALETCKLILDALASTVSVTSPTFSSLFAK